MAELEPRVKSKTNYYHPMAEKTMANYYNETYSYALMKHIFWLSCGLPLGNSVSLFIRPYEPLIGLVVITATVAGNGIFYFLLKQTDKQFAKQQQLVQNALDAAVPHLPVPKENNLNSGGKFLFEHYPVGVIPEKQSFIFFERVRYHP